MHNLDQSTPDQPAGRKPRLGVSSPGEGHSIRLLENAWVDKYTIAKSLITDLEAHLSKMEEIGALVAAAHLAAAVEALKREFGFPSKASDTD
ncbi:hypothetical protein [Novosphingobium kaempferiae]|uniref:hypothetical protein n=1 Tax=Novosphingobium kaempferiae TaxID=2896849 RepID=UPI001E3CF8BE|nr:hypothetical protein [Novosphingobium kaempferiae]